MFRFEFLQGEGDPSFLLSTGEVHLELCVQCLASKYKRDSGTLEWQRARNKIYVLEHLSYKQRMKELSLFSLKKNWVTGDLISCVEIPGGVWRENGAELFLVVPCDRTRANGNKLKYSIFYLSLKSFFLFPMRMVMQWKTLPWETMKFLSLEIFISWVVTALSCAIHRTLALHARIDLLPQFHSVIPLTNQMKRENQNYPEITRLQTQKSHNKNVKQECWYCSSNLTSTALALRLTWAIFEHKLPLNVPVVM